MYIDNTQYVRRTLDDIIKDLPPIREGQHYFLGSKSNYFYAFTLSDYEKGVDDTEKRLLDEARKLLAKNQRQLNALREKPQRERGENKDTYEQCLADWQRRKDLLQSNVSHWREYIDCYVPLREREVVEVYYRKCFNDGVSIIIEGDEMGKVVDFEEYLESITPKVKSRKKVVETEEPKKVENVYLGRQSLLKPYKDDGYKKPYDGKLPKQFSTLYRKWANREITMIAAARICRVHKDTLRLLFYKAQQGEIPI